ncbi:MAG: pyridoxamine 5'-phosphate oxidase family protein [Gammaproteobacteria bacterium]
MAALTSKMKEAMMKVELFPFATASSAGLPNVVPIKFLYVATDDTLWITDNYLNKTLANLRENPRASVYVWSSDTQECFQVKGTIEIKTGGDDYEKMKTMVRAKMPDLPARALVVVHITAIFDCMPGVSAGRQLG